MAADADIRELADAIRDLATAQDRSRQDRVEMRVEGAERGKLVVEAVKEVLASQGAIIESNTKAIDEMRRVKAGAPSWIVAFSLTFNAVLMIFVIALVAQLLGLDAAEAGHVATDIVPDISGLPAPENSGTTPAAEDDL